MPTLFIVKNTESKEIFNVFLEEKKATMCLRRCKTQQVLRDLLLENGVAENLLNNGSYRVLTRSFPSITPELIQTRIASLTTVVVETQELT